MMKNIVYFAYCWTYFNILIFIICFLIWLIGLEIQYPEDWSTITTYSILSFFIFSSLLPLMCLHLRDKFDLISMADGKSHVSQCIWIGLNLLGNSTTAFAQFHGISELMLGGGAR
jgi:hypothetical protein